MLILCSSDVNMVWEILAGCSEKTSIRGNQRGEQLGIACILGLPKPPQA